MLWPIIEPRTENPCSDDPNKSHDERVIHNKNWLRRFCSLHTNRSTIVNAITRLKKYSSMYICVIYTMIHCGCTMVRLYHCTLWMYHGTFVLWYVSLWVTRLKIIQFEKTAVTYLHNEVHARKSWRNISSVLHAYGYLR